MATSSIASPPVETLPLVYIAVKADGAEAARVAASLRAGLAGFDTIDFIGRDTDGTPDPVADATSFIFESCRDQRRAMSRSSFRTWQPAACCCHAI